MKILVCQEVGKCDISKADYIPLNAIFEIYIYPLITVFVHWNKIRSQLFRNSKKIKETSLLFSPDAIWGELLEFICSYMYMDFNLNPH